MEVAVVISTAQSHLGMKRATLFRTVESAYTYRAAFSSTETPIDKQRHYTGSGRDNN
jgi:hypothetical protein